MQNADGVPIGYLDGAGSFWEPLVQTQVMQIHQGAITHDICFLSAQLTFSLIHSLDSISTVFENKIAPAKVYSCFSILMNSILDLNIFIA